MFEECFDCGEDATGVVWLSVGHVPACASHGGGFAFDPVEADMESDLAAIALLQARTMLVV